MKSKHCVLRLTDYHPVSIGVLMRERRRYPPNQSDSPKRSGAHGSPTAPPPTTRLRRRLWRATKWAFATPLSLFGLVAGAVGIWGPLWPVDPEIRPRDPSSLVLPFVVQNKSGLIDMVEPTFRCGVDFVYAQDSLGQTVTFTGAAFVTGLGPTIKAGDSALYTCNASDLLQPRADGSLSLFGSSTKLAMYGSVYPILWKPPFRILKMCVWIGAEYRVWKWRSWPFTSKIFQWPATPTRLQWIEGPIAYSGREGDPFAELKKPTRAFGTRQILDQSGNLRSDAFQCSPTVRYPYSLTTGPGPAILVVEPVPWYRSLWQKIWQKIWQKVFDAK